MISDFIINEEDIVLDQIIGRGSYGSVHKGVYKKTGQAVAIKTRSLEKTDYATVFKMILRDLELMAFLKHPLIVKLIGFIPSPQDIKIVCEYEPNGSLNDVIKSKNRNKAGWFDDTAKTKIAYGIAVAMAHVHSHNIMHRDLKPGNILIDKDYNPIINDFGFAKISKPNEENTTSIGTPMFMAPEVIKENGHYDSKVDVFSYSMILCSLLVDKTTLYEGFKSPFQFYKAVDAGERPFIPDDLSNTKIAQLVRKCWDPVPENRPTFEEIVLMLKTDSELVYPGCNTSDFGEYMNRCSI